jgi:hypothetical protein
VTAAAAVILYVPSLALSSTFGLVGLPVGGYALARGARKWVSVLGMILNAPLAVIALLILFFVSVI